MLFYVTLTDEHGLKKNANGKLSYEISNAMVFSKTLLVSFRMCMGWVRVTKLPTKATWQFVYNTWIVDIAMKHFMSSFFKRHHYDGHIETCSAFVNNFNVISQHNVILLTIA